MTNKRDVELLPCPFCGEKARIMSLLRDDIRIYCQNKNCHIQPMLTRGSEEEAIKAWNTRKGEIQ